jgi:glycosyltransferase involved in cell wall biosynthesis
MKILLVSNFFKPSWETGGVTKVNYEISKNLVARGHKVTVYTTDGYSSRLDVTKNRPVCVDGINVYYFYNLSRSLVKKMKLPTPYYLPFVMRKEIKNFDVIHIHEHRTLLAACVHYYAKKYNVPYVIQAHGSVLPFFQKQLLKKIFDVLFGNKILNDASKAIALNETEASQYEKMGVSPNKIKIVPNGIDLSDFTNSPKKSTFRGKYSISDDTKIILYVGRIHRSKGIDLLVNSYSTLINKIPNSILVLVGPDNEFQDELNKLCEKLEIRENVLFTGFVDKKEKMAAFVDADVFVTPTFTGFPVSFLEACVFGLPIITTTKGDNLDWIDNKVGYVVPYNNKELSDAIFNILSDELIRKRFGDEANKLIETIFSMDSFINNIFSVYQECIEQK